MKFECTVCSYIYDESTEPIKFAELPADWTCPVCGVPKEMFKQIPEENKLESAPAKFEENFDEPEPATMSDALVSGLSDSGVKWVFGMVGHSNLGVAKAIKKFAENGKLNYIGIRHEGAASFACSGYGKLTGKAAACLTIAGPGATNLLTGLCDAHLDNAPVVAITGQIPAADMGANIFQELDLANALSAANPYLQMVFESTDTRQAAKRAVSRAVNEKRVSQITIPDDIQVRPINSKNTASDKSKSLDKVEATMVLSPEIGAADSAQIEKAAKFISDKKYPIIIIGNGAKNALEEVVKLSKTLRAPILTTYRAKGFVPDSDELSCGVVGRSGTPVAGAMLSKTDCIIAVGMGFSRHSSIPQNKSVVQIDIDPNVFGKRHSVDFALVGDAAKTVKILSEILDKKNSSADPREEIKKLWNDWRIEKSNRAAKSEYRQLSPTAVCNALSKYVDSDAIISVDVGNVAYVFGRSFEAKNQRFLLSFYLGSIGVGLPAAMGAWCATQEKDSPFFGKQVVAVVGDGGLGQYLAEWTSVVKNKMNIKCVVLNNSQLAKISAEQRNVKMEVWQTDLLNPSFADYSKLCGGEGVKIENISEIDSKLSEAFSNASPTIIEAFTSAEKII